MQATGASAYLASIRNQDSVLVSLAAQDMKLIDRSAGDTQITRREISLASLIGGRGPIVHAGCQLVDLEI